MSREMTEKWDKKGMVGSLAVDRTKDQIRGFRLNRFERDTYKG